jgi:hypothetical protein
MKATPKTKVVIESASCEVTSPAEIGMDAARAMEIAPFIPPSIATFLHFKGIFLSGSLSNP